VTARKAIPPETAALVVQGRREGKKLNELADETRLSYRQVRKALESAGLGTRRPEPSAPVDLAETYREAMSIPATAKALGVGYDTAARLLQDAGIEINPPGYGTSHEVTNNRRRGHL
jgi:hypothetical protein